MGREIVYCQSCGERLTETEFDRGKAQMIDNRPYCSRCRPLTAPPPPGPSAAPAPERRGTTTKRRKTSTAHIPRVSAPAEPSTRRPEGKGGPVGWIAGGVVAVAIVLLVAAATTGRKHASPAAAAVPPASPPETPATAGETAGERLRELEEFAAQVTDAEAILVRCDQLRATFRDTPLEPRFKQVESRAMERHKEKSRSAELDRALASIRKMIQEDPAGARRVEVENLLEAALKSAGPRSAEVRKLQEEHKAVREEATRRKEPEKPVPAARGWAQCFALAGQRIAANDYPGAKDLYLEGLSTLPPARPEELNQRFLYAAGLYNLACIYSVESAKLPNPARKEAMDGAFRHLDRALRADYGRFRCPCHAQTGGVGHMAEDKDMDPLRGDPRYAELIRKFR